MNKEKHELTDRSNTMIREMLNQEAIKKMKPGRRMSFEMRIEEIDNELENAEALTEKCKSFEFLHHLKRSWDMLKELAEEVGYRKYRQLITEEQFHKLREIVNEPHAKGSKLREQHKELLGVLHCRVALQNTAEMALRHRLEGSITEEQFDKVCGVIDDLRLKINKIDKEREGAQMQKDQNAG